MMKLPNAWRLVLMLLALALPPAGCEFIAYVAPREHTYDVTAQYDGLEDKTVAVIVAADEYTLFRFPKAPEYTCKAVSAAIQGTVPGVTVTDPQTVIAYLEKHPYWSTLRYSKIVDELKVERLLIIDLAEYRTHEPGNTHIWRGVMSGNIAVIEADADDPDDVALSFDLSIQFPEDESVGVLDESDETMQLGMLKLFSRDVARLFHDHEIKQ